MLLWTCPLQERKRSNHFSDSRSGGTVSVNHKIPLSATYT